MNPASELAPETPPICPACGCLLDGASVEEPCPACLLAIGVTSESVFFGAYEQLQLLGEGGMALVHLARHRQTGELVALKIAKPELLENPRGASLFHQQGRAVRELRHRHIVQVQECGTCDGLPYLVMPLMERGALSECDNLARFAEPAARLDLMLKIGRAVQFAHGRGILHCDLKHDNILFDEVMEPHVSDFGLARTMNGSGVTAGDGIRGGTFGWMSPEQVKGEVLTATSDVFALGIMLYLLTTGCLPFGNAADFELRVLEEPPPPMGPWTPGLDWNLLAIAHRAVQKAPERRYQTAAAFSDDLERVRTMRPILGWRTPVWGRVWLWTERHPGARNLVLFFLPVLALVFFVLASAQRDELRRSVLDMNAYAASGQAASVLYQLREYAEALDKAAEDPAVKALTQGPRHVEPPQLSESSASKNPCSMQTALEDPSALKPHAARFATMLVMNRYACPRARLSNDAPPLSFIQTRLDWRGHFAGAHADAARGIRTSHVRKAYRSIVSQYVKASLSTPIFEAGEWIGVVMGSITAESTLEMPRMKRTETQDRMTVLIGPIEGDDSASVNSLEQEFAFLAHPRLKRGQKATLDHTVAREFDRVFPAVSESTRQFELGTAIPLQRADYVDPLMGDRWLAAFAPVGATGYVVLVQSRDSAATKPSEPLARLALLLGGISVVLLLWWGGFSLWRIRAMR